MSPDPFTRHLSSIIPLPDDLIKVLHGMTGREIYQPHQIIHAAGQKEMRLWFVVEGLVRTYYFDHTGKEHTHAFFREQDMLFSYQGYWQQNADRYIEAIERTELVSLSYVDLKELLQDYPEIRRLQDIFLQNHEQQEQFRKRLLTWAAEERYLQTRKAQPDLFRRLSVRLIATYLNMTRENLSRLMARDL